MGDNVNDRGAVQRRWKSNYSGDPEVGSNWAKNGSPNLTTYGLGSNDASELG